MKQSFKAHFDGRVFVPDEPVDAPINTPLRLSLENGSVESSNGVRPTRDAACQREFLAKITGIVSGPPVDPDSLLRENLYDDRA